MTFEARVMQRLRQRAGLRNVRAPSKNVEWLVEGPHDGPQTLIARVRASELIENIQTDAGAIPTFLVAFAYWLEREVGQPVSCKLIVDGEPSSGIQHWNRSLFVIDQLQRVLGARFSAELHEPWRWPREPLMNVEADDRSGTGAEGAHRENVFEHSLRQSSIARTAFGLELGPIDEFRRQLPVGLFSETFKTRWLPGGNSQVDLWARSTDGHTVHLFELKATTVAKKLGILSQAFFYARLLHHVRVGLADGTRIKGSGPGLDAIRNAACIRMWLVGEKMHPLVLSDSSSPLEWLNLGMRQDGVALGIIPVELSKDGCFVRWRLNERWPR